MADECPAVLQGLNDSLTSLRRAEVVGEATSVEKTLRLARALRPDFVFLDPSFHVRASIPLRDGEIPEMDVCRELRFFAGPLRIIAYSSFNTTADLMALRLAKVDGYVHKSTPLEQVARDLGNAFAGRRPPWRLGLEPEEAQRRLMVASRAERLSRMEKEVLTLVLKRCADQQITGALHISDHTLKKHVSSMLVKLEYRYRRDIFRD